MELNDQEQLRRKALDELYSLGINPYPAELFEFNATSKYILDNFERDPSALTNLSIASIPFWLVFRLL